MPRATTDFDLASFDLDDTDLDRAIQEEIADRGVGVQSKIIADGDELAGRPE